MLDKRSAVAKLLERLVKLPEGHSLEIRTYKRNRRVLFQRTSENTWVVLQDGFAREIFENVPLEKLRKLVHSLLRKEFPRSTKIRLYALGPCDSAEAALLERKVL